MRLGVTPVPIPNTMVKTQAADGTALETVWESRWLPEFEEKKNWFYQWSEDWRDSVFWWLMKQAVRVFTLRLKNQVFLVACRHVMKQNISQLVNASIQRRKYSFRNVPWKLHIRNRNDKINILFKTSEVIVINRNVVNNYNTFEKTK